MFECKKCKTGFQPWNSLVEKKIQNGHVPLCKDCWAAVYGSLSMDMGKVAQVQGKVKDAAVPPSGTKTFICLDCTTENREHWTSRVRAARLRCPGCGSLRYEPKTVDAKDDLTSLRDIAKAAQHAKGQDQKFRSFEVR